MANSSWNDFKQDLKHAANTFVKKTDELANEASIALRKKTAQVELYRAQARLGRLIYPYLKENRDVSSDEEIRNALSEVNRRAEELASYQQTAEQESKADEE